MPVACGEGAERSKALRQGRNLFGGVGSNPTLVTIFRLLALTGWPSGLRRQTQVLVSSEARVRTPLLSPPFAERRSRQDSNLQPLDPRSNALPLSHATAAEACKSTSPSWVRTSDLQVNSLTRYRLRHGGTALGRGQRRGDWEDRTPDPWFTGPMLCH